jgi:dTDP-4-dehydrorhamnose reductase
MKIFVTGCTGMLGSAVMSHLGELGHDAVGVDLTHPDPAFRLDVSDRAALKAFAPLKDCGLVLHLAAATDVDRCEGEPELAFKANALAPELLAGLCAERGVPMAHIGTGAVFAGNPKREPYNEYDEPAPKSVYALSKLRGEAAVRERHPKHYIVRAGWMMGSAAAEKKFVGKIAQQLRSGRRELKAVGDKRGSPTYTVDFARNLMVLVGSGLYGTYHMANHGACTRAEMARRIAALMGVDASVTEVPSSAFPLPAHRPDSECLDNLKLRLLGLDRMRPWEDALADYVRTLPAAGSP